MRTVLKALNEVSVALFSAGCIFLPVALWYTGAIV